MSDEASRAYRGQVTEIIDGQSRDGAWSPPHPVELFIRNRRAIGSSDMLTEAERQQIEAMFPGEDYGAYITDGIEDMPMDLEVADVVDADGNCVYRLWGWNFGVVYLTAPAGRRCHAFASQHVLEVWELAQRDLFFAMDRALQRKDHGFRQPMSFPWAEQPRWDAVATKPQGTAFSHPWILKQFPE